MSLIIEDGSVVLSADSFLNLADARTMASKYGLTLPTEDDAAEVVLRQGYLSLSQREQTLQGWRVSADQTGIFPRSGVLSNCYPVDPDIIPDDVKLAQLYAADAIGSGLTTNNIDDGQKLAGFNVQGVYSETYQAGSKQPINPSVQGVYNALYPLTKAGLAASPCGGSGLYRTNMGYI